MKNLALQWLAEHDTCVGDIGCVELAGEVADAHGGKIAWLERSKAMGESPWLAPDWCGIAIWKYHAVAVVDGVVHDPWGPGPMPLKRWVSKAFPSQLVDVSFPGEDWEPLVVDEATTNS
jgi:hypothetical protein